MFFLFLFLAESTNDMPDGQVAFRSLHDACFLSLQRGGPSKGVGRGEGDVRTCPIYAAEKFGEFGKVAWLEISPDREHEHAGSGPLAG